MMGGYHWHGHTRRHTAYRRWADAQWEHDQRCRAQRGRKGRAVVDIPAPAPTTARTWQTQAIAATIRRPLTVTARQGITS
jgi:hypothetical protein